MVGIVLIVLAGWCLACLIAWALNRSDIRNFYGEAPFSWRVFTYRLLYIPWLEKRQERNE